jgi:type IV secretion system protein VirB9
MNTLKRLTTTLLNLSAVWTISGCATHGVPPPTITLDDPAPAMVAAQRLPDPPRPVEIVEVPTLLPLPEQLKSVGSDASSNASSITNTNASVNTASGNLATPGRSDKPSVESLDEKVRVTRANAEARVAPSRDGYVNAIQVWPYSDGALYQVYTSPGRVTVIALQEGEELVTVSAGDTVRWIVGDTASGAGAGLRVNILVKPTRAGLATNLVITTHRRTYLLELTSTPQAWMASVSWDYPKDRMLALQKQAQQAQAAAPVETGLLLEQLKFRYAITGDSPPWKPVRAFDDGERVYIQFPGGIAQGELPPLFVIGLQGDGQLVNYRFRSPYYVLDRLFGAAELRLGADKAAVVRITRTDGVVAAAGVNAGIGKSGRH